jgi:hypothetical protein
VLLYRHAWRQRDRLGLTDVDRLRLKYGQRAHLISMGLGLSSVSLAFISGSLVPVSGLLYFLMGPLHGWNGYVGGKAVALAEREAAAAR